MKLKFIAVLFLLLFVLSCTHVRTNNLKFYGMNKQNYQGFTKTGHKVSSRQPWEGLSVYTQGNTTIFQVKAGRHGTGDVADWFLKDLPEHGKNNVFPSSFTSDTYPRKLNFAIKGKLTLKNNVVIDDFRFGQGHTPGSRNNWWVGGSCFSVVSKTGLLGNKTKVKNVWKENVWKRTKVPVFWTNEVTIKRDKVDSFDFAVNSFPAPHAAYDGLRIRASGTAKVYFVWNGGHKSGIPDWTVNDRIFTDRTSIIELEPSHVDGFPVGLEISTDARMAMEQDDKVYLVTNNEKHHVTSPDVIAYCHFKWPVSTLTPSRTGFEINYDGNCN